MEFHVETAGKLPDLDGIQNALCAIDASALVDLDPSGPTLRVSAAVDPGELILLLGRNGYPVDARQVTQLPSTCCGGCGG